MPAIDEDAPPDEAADLRMPWLAVAAWAGGLLAAQARPTAAFGALVGVLVLLGALTRRRPGAVITLAAGGLVAAAVLASALLRGEAVTASPVAALAGQGAAVEVTGVVVSDPRPVAGPYGDQVVVRLEVREVVGRGLRHRLAVPVVVLGEASWAQVPLGATVGTRGRLVPSDDDLAGLLTGASAPTTLAGPDVWWRGAGAVRASIRDAVAHRPDDQRALVPALVDGDDGGLSEELEADFQTTGLTHLTAVSGTNVRSYGGCMTTATQTLTGREYLRISQDRTGTGKSPDQQHDENMSAFPGALGAPYREPGSASASRYARKAREVFTGLLSDLSAGDFGADALVLWESSRGSRTVGEWVQLLDVCEAQQVRIFVTTHGRLYDPQNARDRRTLLEDAVDSEYESAKNSARIRRNTAAVAATGKPHGRVLFGYERIYDYDARGVRTFREQVIREDQAAIVRESATRLLSGDSCYGIAKSLNDRGVPIPHKPINDRNPAEWNGAQIRRMLLNPGYNGKRVHRGQVVGDASWPAILDDETFVSLTRILNDPSRKQIKDGAVKYLLTGILTCEKCRRISRVMPQRGGYRAYHCKEFCTARRIDFVDAYISELVVARLSDPEVLRALAPADDENAPDVFAQIEKKRTMLEEMEELVMTGEISPVSFARMEKRALAEIDELERVSRKNSVSPVVHELAGPDAEEKWDVAELTQKREVIRALFADIQMLPVPPENRGKRGFDESLIRPVWTEGLERLPVRRRLTPVPPLEEFPQVGKRARIKARAAEAPALSAAQLDKIARALDN